jgi:hypothetical protein
MNTVEMLAADSTPLIKAAWSLPRPDSQFIPNRHGKSKRQADLSCEWQGNY